MKINQITPRNYSIPKSTRKNTNNANLVKPSKTSTPAFGKGNVYGLFVDCALDYVSKEKKFLFQSAGRKVEESLDKIFKTPEFKDLNIRTLLSEQKDKYSKSFSVLDEIFYLFDFNVTYKHNHYAGIQITRQHPKQYWRQCNVTEINFFERIKDKPSPEVLAQRVIDESVERVRESVRNEAQWLRNIADLDRIRGYREIY